MKTDGQFLLELADVLRKKGIEGSARVWDIAYRLPSQKPPILIGTRVWRAVITDGDQLIIREYSTNTKTTNTKHDDFNFELDGKGGVVFRASQGAFSYYKDNLWCVLGSSARGLVCISKEIPDTNWTHFEVTGLSKKQNVAFGKFVVGPVEELAAQYSPPDSKFRNSKPQEAA